MCEWEPHFLNHLYKRGKGTQHRARAFTASSLILLCKVPMGFEALESPLEWGDHPKFTARNIQYSKPLQWKTHSLTSEHLPQCFTHWLWVRVTWELKSIKIKVSQSAGLIPPFQIISLILYECESGWKHLLEPHTQKLLHFFNQLLFFTFVYFNDKETGFSSISWFVIDPLDSFYKKWVIPYNSAILIHFSITPKL